MAGITRIIITDTIRGRGAYRFEEARRRQPAANKLYGEIFNTLNSPLEPGYDELLCQKDDIAAAYDRLLGVDVIFRFTNGMSATLQEKFLTTRYDTVTVEYYDSKQDEEEGDWFNLRAQFYFVGYDRANNNTLQDWVLLNWVAVQLATNQGAIEWKIRKNNYDGARANFKYTHINNIPPNCIIDKFWRGQRFVRPQEGESHNSLSQLGFDFAELNEAYLNELHHAPYNYD